MTGFGSAQIATANESIKISTEISTVNRKQLELRVTLPRELNCFEIAVKQQLQKYLQRGMINVKISMDLNDAIKAQGIKINSAFIEEVYNQTQELESKLHVPQENKIAIKDILRIHGAFEEKDLELPIKDIEKILIECVNQAASEVVTMREAEGDFLQKDIQERLKVVDKCVTEAEKFAEEIPAIQREKLMKKLKDADLNIELADDRVIREIIIFAERADVSEEITRLKSHFVQFNDHIKKSQNEAVGRSIDFILQEMNREVTTLGNKVGNSNISPLVITMKTQLEKIREQIQNVE